MGVMLVAPEATHITANPAFRIKVAAVVPGLIAVGVLEVLARRAFGRPPGSIRASAGISLAIWLCVAAPGRLIAYF